MIGTQIGGYLIQEKLGEGGMGTVYRALETNLDRLVAIKVLNADVARDASIGERFRAEARAQAHLNHTNIATLYNFLIHEGAAMMVMEYIDGESFQQVVDRRGPIPAQEIVPLFKQALLGLGAAHRMGIVHRDIKPSNIMLNKTGIVKVMDFGIAKAMGGSRGLTRTGIQVGTVFYMSPEQVKGERVDIRSDIYSLGVTLYEMLTAHVPFSAASDFQVLSDHVNTAPPLPTKFYPYVPKGVENIVLKALEKNPDDRFQTVEEFGAALDHPEAWETYQPQASGAIAPVVAPVAPALATSRAPDPGATRLQSSASIPLPVTPALASEPAVASEPAPAAPAARKTLPVAPKWIAAAAAALLIVVSALAYVALRPKPAPPPVKPSIAESTPHQETSSPGPILPSSANNAPPSSLPELTPDAVNPPAQQTATSGGVSNATSTRKHRATQGGTDTDANAPAHEESPAPPVSAPAPVLTPVTTQLTIPAATQIAVKLINAIDGDTAQPGQIFAASIDAAVTVNGETVVPRFAEAQVRLVSSAKAGRFKGEAKLDLALASLTVAGRRYEVQSAVYEATSGGRGKRTGKFAGIGGAVGAVVGGIERGGKGLVEGAAAGGAAGGGAAALTGNRELELPAESRLSFTLNAPIIVAMRR
jgi:serine/threonine protein kinase